MVKKNISLHIIGDSHVMPLCDLSSDKYFYNIKQCVVQGATASGLMNPHSKTLSGPIFTSYLEKIFSDDYVIIHLGEVDCGFTMWVRSERENISIEEQMTLTLDNYFKLIKNIYDKTNKIFILNILPQTIKDNVKIGDVANFRGKIKANIDERTNLTNKMNNEIKKYSNDLNIFFIDTYKEFIDEETKIIKDEFLNKNSEDHHLDPHNFLKVLNKKIQFFLDDIK